MPAACLFERLSLVAGIVLGAAVATAAGPAAAQIGPQTTVLIDRLCAQTLRTNEEDRLYGMISNAVRSTIRYRGAPFQPDLIDEAVQDSLDALIESCPELTLVPEAQRITMAIEIVSSTTSKALEDNKTNPEPVGNGPLDRRPTERLTAADLSEQLSSQDIDQWLNAMPPRQRALTLFLYASDVTPHEIAAAVGEPLHAVAGQATAARADLLRIYREEFEEASATPRPGAGAAMQYRETGGAGFTAFMPGGPAPPEPVAAAAPPAGTAPASGDPDEGAVTPAAAAPQSRPAPARPSPLSVATGLTVTGISNDLYAGWSLLATARGLPKGQRIEVAEPFLLLPDAQGIRRMIVVGVAELGDPRAETRRFLLKAYAIDGQGEAAGVRDLFHLGPTAIDNEEAKKTLANPNLSSIEVARCLWHDYGTGDDPGLCR